MKKTEIKRPQFTDEMVATLAKKYAQELKPFTSYKSIEDIEKDCIEIFEYNYSENGYELSKRFDDKFGYKPDTMMVETLDCVYHDANDILKVAVKEWVKANDIKLELSIGTAVLVNAWKKNNEEGYITKLYPETAEYGVWSPSLDGEKGKICAIYEFEKVKLGASA